MNGSRKKSMAPRSQLKEWLLHSQKVHFALVTACVGLIVAANLGRKSDAAVALEELRSIMDAVDGWDMNWLHEVGESHAASDVPTTVGEVTGHKPMISGALGCVTAWDDEKVGLTLSRWWTLHPLRSKSVDGRESTWWVGSDGRCSVPKPETIQEFMWIWDELREVRFHYVTAVMPEGTVHFSDSSRVFSPQDCDIDSELFQVIDMNLVMAEQDPFDTSSTSSSGPAPAVENGEYELVGTVGKELNRTRRRFIFAMVTLPVESESLILDGRRALNSKMGSKFHLQDFSSGFSDLYNVTRDYQDFGFDQVRRVLESEKARSPVTFHIFGAEIPSDRLAIFGIPIVLLMQLYLLSHIRNAPKACLVTAEDAVPWIGLYRDLLGRGLLWASTVALEPLAIGLLAWHGSSQMTPAMRIILLTGCSGSGFAIGLVSVRLLLRFGPTGRNFVSGRQSEAG